MAKTQEEMVGTAMRDWDAKHSSDKNWLKSRLDGAWKSGYAFAEQTCLERAQVVYSVKMEAEKNVAYQRGLEDAWKAAKKAMAEIDYEDFVNTFGAVCAVDNALFFDRYSASEAIEKLAPLTGKPKQEDKIELGDVVEAFDTNKWVKFIAAGDIGDGTIMGFTLNGGIYEYSKASCRKTGERYNISLAVGARAD